MKPHVHAELIKAWADGATIEAKCGEVWRSFDYPGFHPGREYRVKPAEDPYKQFKDAAAEGKRVDWRDPSTGKWIELRPAGVIHWAALPPTSYRVALPWQDERDAFAAGKTIQFRSLECPEMVANPWLDAKTPTWDGAMEYRVKPEIQEREAPATIYHAGVSRPYSVVLTFEDDKLVAIRLKGQPA